MAIISIDIFIGSCKHLVGSKDKMAAEYEKNAGTPGMPF